MLCLWMLSGCLVGGAGTMRNETIWFNGCRGTSGFCAGAMSVFDG